MKNRCPGCGASVLWDNEELVPSMVGLGEPPDVLIRYLMTGGLPRSRHVVHKCPVTTPMSHSGRADD